VATRGSLSWFRVWAFDTLQGLVRVEAAMSAIAKRRSLTAR